MKTFKQLFLEATVEPGDMPNFKYTKEDHAQLIKAIHSTIRDKDFYFIVQCMQKAWEKFPNAKMINGLNLIQGIMSYSVNDIERLAVATKRVINGRERSALPTAARGIVQRLQKFLTMYQDRLASARTPTPQDIKDRKPAHWQPKSDFSKVKVDPPQQPAQSRKPFSWSSFEP